MCTPTRNAHVPLLYRVFGGEMPTFIELGRQWLRHIALPGYDEREWQDLEVLVLYEARIRAELKEQRP